MLEPAGVQGLTPVSPASPVPPPSQQEQGCLSPRTTSQLHPSEILAPFTPVRKSHRILVGLPGPYRIPYPNPGPIPMSGAQNGVAGPPQGRAGSQVDSPPTTGGWSWMHNNGAPKPGEDPKVAGPPGIFWLFNVFIAVMGNQCRCFKDFLWVDVAESSLP